MMLEVRVEVVSIEVACNAAHEDLAGHESLCVRLCWSRITFGLRGHGVYAPNAARSDLEWRHAWCPCSLRTSLERN